jgi:large subunit ribosomal protein L28
VNGELYFSFALHPVSGHLWTVDRQPWTGVLAVNGTAQTVNSLVFRKKPVEKTAEPSYIQGISLLLHSKISKVMARVCQVTGKVPIGGNSVSHSNIKTKRRFLPNLQTKRLFLAEENKWITLKLSADGLRTINKRGLYSVVKELRAQGQHI